MTLGELLRHPSSSSLPAPSFLFSCAGEASAGLGVVRQLRRRRGWRGVAQRGAPNAEAKQAAPRPRAKMKTAGAEAEQPAQAWIFPSLFLSSPGAPSSSPPRFGTYAPERRSAHPGLHVQPHEVDWQVWRCAYPDLEDDEGRNASVRRPNRSAMIRHRGTKVFFPSPWYPCPDLKRHS